MTARMLVVGGCVAGFLGVALGAFGAHGLEGLLSAEALGWWETATSYLLPHAVLVASLGFASVRGGNGLTRAGWCLLAGATVFAGSLYALALTGFRPLGAVTPIGGLLLLIGWGWAGASALRLRP